MTKKAFQKLQAVKGMVDILPPQSRRLQAVERICHKVLHSYGYSPVLTPIVEYTSLFTRSIGDETDIVEKEMYTFSDRDERSLTMRPEGTASVARAFIEHSIDRAEPVTRWYYWGPMFRHERAQRGRYRQFFQLGAEALGVETPGIDAEMITMLVQLFTDLGLSDLDVHLNTLGCPECRPAFRGALLAYLAPHEKALCEDCQRRFQQNPLRVLDCKVRGCNEIAAGAPTSLDLTCDACRKHWEGLLGDLQLQEVPYQVDHRLVRGLDYYTRTTFEVLSSSGNLGSQNTIAGGGRYDGLIEGLGGPQTPAIGFAMGLERLLLALGDDQPVLSPSVQVCIVARGEQTHASAIQIAQKLRRAGLAVDLDHRGTSVKSQMKRANRLGCSHVLMLGEDEYQRGMITLRNMVESSQLEVSLDEVVEKLIQISPP